MCDHLDKAKAALLAAKEAENDKDHQLDLLHVAQVQATVSAADSLARIAERLVGPRVEVEPEVIELVVGDDGHTLELAPVANGAVRH